jgi:hypothetical protein
MTAIRLNDRELGILRAIAAGPRTKHSFTYGTLPLSENAVDAYLKTLTDAEFITLPPRRDCDYPVTQAGLDYLARLRSETASSRIWCNASTLPGSYKGEISKEPARGAAALVAFGLPSLGFGA